MINYVKKYKYDFMVFILFFNVAFLLNIKILHCPFLVLEDGEVFINQFFNYGIKSLFMKYGGYLVLFSRIITAISYFFGLIFSDFIIFVRTKIVLCVLFSSYVLYYFTTNNFSFIISNKKMRIFVALIIEVLISCFAWLFYSQTSIHWWCGLYAILVSLELLNNKMPNIINLIILLICLLSSISSLVITFAVVYYIIVNNKKLFKNYNKNNLYKLITILVFIIIQSIFILFVKNTNQETILSVHNIKSLFILIKCSYDLTISSFNFFLGSNFYFTMGMLKLNKYMGLFILLVMLYFSKKNKKLKYFVFCISSIYTLYFLILFKDPTPTIMYEGLLSNNHHLWYNCLPCVLITLLFFINILKYYKGDYRIVILVLFIFLLINNIQFSSHPEFETNKNLYYINDYVDYSSKKYTKAIIVPDYKNWYVYIPVNDDYCSIEGNVCYEEIEYNYNK